VGENRSVVRTESVVQRSVTRTESVVQRSEKKIVVKTRVW